MSDPTPPAVSDAMREAVARTVLRSHCVGEPSALLLAGAYQSADNLLKLDGPIASEIDRLTEERDAAVKRARAAEKALVSLTPDGSEYYSRDGEGYRLDVPACMAFITRAQDDKHNTIKRLIRLKQAAEAALSRLQADRGAEVGKLRATLGDLRTVADDLAQISIREGDNKAAGALQYVSGFISDTFAALTETPDA